MQASFINKTEQNKKYEEAHAVQSKQQMKKGETFGENNFSIARRKTQHDCDCVIVIVFDSFFLF